MHDKPHRWEEGLSMREQLSEALAKKCRDSGLNQREAGKLIDMDQGQVSALIRGKATLSVEKLIYHLGKAGVKFEWSLKDGCE